MKHMTKQEAQKAINGCQDTIEQAANRIKELLDHIELLDEKERYKVRLGDVWAYPNSPESKTFNNQLSVLSTKNHAFVFGGLNGDLLSLYSDSPMTEEEVRDHLYKYKCVRLGKLELNKEPK